MSIFFKPKNLSRRQRLHRRARSHAGFTIIEILIVLALAGIMAAMSAPYISFGNNPLLDRTNRIAGDFKLVRAKAMANTSAYRISQASPTQLKVKFNKSCLICDTDDDTSTCVTDVNNPWKQDPSFTDEDLSLTEASDIRGLAKNAKIQFTPSATFTNSSGITTTPLDASGQPNWKLCYDSRGITNANLKLFLKDMKTNKGKRIEVFSAGGTQVDDYNI